MSTTMASEECEDTPAIVSGECEITPSMASGECVVGTAMSSGECEAELLSVLMCQLLAMALQMDGVYGPVTRSIFGRVGSRDISLFGIFGGALFSISLRRVSMILWLL